MDVPNNVPMGSGGFRGGGTGVRPPKPGKGKSCAVAAALDICNWGPEDWGGSGEAGAE
jgi:hypothetical protein